MKLVVGLGNPGRQYQETRHNIGYMVLAELASRIGSFKSKNRFQGEVVEMQVAGEQVILLSPSKRVFR